MKFKLAIFSMFSMLVVSTLACNEVTEQANIIGNTAFANLNYDAAVTSYQRAMIVAPDRAELRYNLGNAYYARGEFDEAVEQYEMALPNADDVLSQRGLFNLGNAYFKQRNFDDAAEVFKEVLRLNPNDEDARYNLELAYRQLGGEAAPAEEEFQEEQSGQSENPDSQGQDDQQPEDEQNQQNEDDESDQSDSPELTEEQARQLLESIGQNTESLRGHLHQVYVVSGDAPSQDW